MQHAILRNEMMKKQHPVKPPLRRERLSLQLMIIIGLSGMIFFLYNLLQPENVGYAVFYWMLIFAVSFKCLKILHEWYHYFFITIPPRPETTKTFTVDILTTFYPGEPYEMIEETLRAIQAIRYPHTTYLGDEGNDPYIKQLCLSLGVVHVTRNDRVDAKAGNINNILKVATGELCVVLDPDHVPAPEFLDSIVPHFSNPEIGYVQIVQAYKNLDESLVAKGAAQQTFQFYGPMMMTMNRYGTVMAIGANCTFRRAALDAIGGHAAGLAEDMHTAMQLHAKGWKSVYVPEVLARGLVPSALSGYYKQQLKWARGTFELLITTYPKLFRSFTWRQKLHYGTLPFHYFSGVICLINFLIPACSLVLGIIPLKVDLVTFAVIGLPFIISVTLIRHVVQQWVMEEEERGFHMVGGILLIGTWWVYILGLVYTIIRKPVPYLPTPKNNEGHDPWNINIPNIIIALISITAIAYGLYTDWNPYSIFMACLTGLNFLFMIFTIYASREQVFRKMNDQSAVVKKISGYSRAVKRLLWLFRHQLYSAMRGLALPVLLATVALTYYIVWQKSEMPAATEPHYTGKEDDIFYAGIYSPGPREGISELADVAAFEKKSGVHFNMIACYIAWGPDSVNLPGQKIMNSVFDRGAIPFITWEPWVSTFRYSQYHPASASEEHALRDIYSGTFDDYIHAFALRLKSLNRPVFLRFAHEFNNPAYPWSQTGHNTPEDFRLAWIHVHQKFKEVGAGNVIWVWSPWSAENAEAYFPGTAYVDWLSVTALDYNLTDSKSYSFRQLYEPFHKLPVFESGLPVMIAEMGTLNSSHQTTWFKEAYSVIDTVYDEIKGSILFNSDRDRNVVAGAPRDGAFLNWSILDPSVFTVPASTEVQADNLELLWNYSPTVRPTPSAVLTNIRGVNFSKGKNWFKNFHALTRRELETDIRRMKALGINTIKRYGPGIYDRNVLAIVEDEDMKLHYNFWIDDHLNVVDDTIRFREIAREIVSTVKDWKDRPGIVAWNLNNQLWKRLKERYPKPALFHHQMVYMQWLQQVVESIKRVDPDHPVTLDLPVSGNLLEDYAMLQSHVASADAFGLTMGAGDKGLDIIPQLKGEFFFSEMPVDQYVKQTTDKGVYISEWQDLHERNIIAVNGLLDHWGRAKPDYFSLGKAWQTVMSSGNDSLPEIRILRPAAPTIPGHQLKYHAVVERNGAWSVADGKGHLNFEWYLFKTDGFGNNTYMKKLGTGPATTITIPDEPLDYKIYLIVENNGNVKTTLTTLNTPLPKKKTAD
jgi:cellulose synthase (UDP-forming)